MLDRLPRTSRRVSTTAAVTILLALLLPSSARAISSRTLLNLTGGGVADYFGFSTGTAGDVNGDGYADVIVGARFGGGANSGQAYVYYGGPAANATADLTFTGDAISDEFGWSVGTAGDVNGDGYADLIVGALLNDAGGADAGRAYVYYGGPAADGTADLTLTGAAAGDQFGISVGTAGDVNGDGYADLIVGAYSNDAGGADAGRAYVFYGGPAADATADLTLTGALAGDLFGVSVGTAGDVNGDGYADLIVGAHQNDAGGLNAGRAYVYYGGPTANAIADLTLTGAAAGDFFGRSAGEAGDVNGDGYADLIVGAYQNDAAGVDAGRAYVYYGGPSADATADLTLTGAAAGDFFGYSVGTAGDANGDGHADLIVGASRNDAGAVDAGRAYVYYGGPAADATADLTLTGAQASELFGWSVRTAGDVDGDGHDDLIVGAYLSDAVAADAGRAVITSVYPYQVLSPNGGEQWVAGRSETVRWRGHDVADLAISFDGGASWSTLAGGVGGTEENEITVIAPGPATALARVRVGYAGQAATHATSDASDGVFSIVLPRRAPAAASRLQLTPTGAAAGDFLGISVGTAGDVNGDGYADLIVGAFGNDAGGSDAGRAYVYYGGPAANATADLTFTGATANDWFGNSVATAGDVNGDGYADVIVGAPQNDAGGAEAGRAYVYYGGPSPDDIADLTLTGAAADDQFGNAVGTAGDVNGDGYADLIVGAYANNAGGVDAGRAYVYYGGPAADATADLTLTGAAANDFFGFAVGTAGDVNGDGYADVMVGAIANDAGGADAGRAYVYYGGLSPNTTADLTLTGAAAGDDFGYSVGTPGDVNGDGFADVIVGASLNDAGGSDAGRAYVYYGGPSADATADLILTGAAAGDALGISVGTAGDVNGDSFADVIVGASGNDAGGANAGRAYVYYGGPSADATADLTLTGVAAGDNFGISAGSGGDVNGDGYADLIVGASGNNAGGVDAGRAYVYDCNRYFVSAPNGGETWNVGATESISWLGAEPADLWLSLDGGATHELLETGVGGAESNTVPVRVPHLPTRFARIRVTPSDHAIGGSDRSDSLFTIQSSVSLLSLVAELAPEGGAQLTWSTDPGVGPDGLAGYRVYRTGAGGAGTRIGPELIAESRFRDAAGSAGSRYRVAAVNGLGAELTLGEVSLMPARPLAAWPLPYREGAMRISFATAGGLGGGTGEARVELFDLAGRKVRTIASGAYRAGYQNAVWDGRDDAGRGVRNGIYFLLARSGGETAQVKVVVAR